MFSNLLPIARRFWNSFVRIFFDVKGLKFSNSNIFVINCYFKIIDNCCLFTNNVVPMKKYNWFYCCYIRILPI